jgi:nucleotide-binding universal stress UspA family protein
MPAGLPLLHHRLGTHEEARMDEAPILICYDGSDEAGRAIDAAAGLLGARRAVVLDIGPVLTTAESVAAVSSIVPGTAFEDLNMDDALRRARAGAELARRAGFEAEARGDLAAPTWEGIVDAADEIDAAVIVIGSRGLSGAKEVFEGSVSHQVAEHASRPVLIVPPPKTVH